jgi:hypothetical protein
MSALSTVAPTISKLIPRLGSNHDGEVIATARAIQRVLRGAGRDWHDLAAVVSPPTANVSGDDWRAMARFCVDRGDSLSDREWHFITTLAQYRSAPTHKQMQWLQDIAARLRVAA